MPPGPARRDPSPDSTSGGEPELPVRPGDRVGHYQIVDAVGHGGMGVIFRAHDTRLGRDVALKCPWPRLAADATMRERFLREARAASQLTHPHVLPIFQTFKWGGLPWIAMELVDGPSLRLRLFEEGPVPVRTGLGWAEGLSDALRAAHDKGIVHRDINPNNILLRGGDWPLLTDFGLAQRVDTDSADSAASTASGRLTEPGHVIGTRGYMSPEQVLGRPVGPRSDLFSLGAVLYEMFTGKRAFPGDSASDANEAVLREDPVAMSSLVPAVPAELERIVRRAMAKQPHERPADARELHDEIAAVRRQVDSADYVSAPPPALPARPLAAWLKAGAAAALLAGLAVYLARAVPGRGPAPAARGPFAVGTPRQITSDPAGEAEPVLSPGGDLIAYTVATGHSSDIWVTDIKGASRLRLTEGGARDDSPAWFPDGSALAFVSNRSGERSIWKVPRLGGPPSLLVPRAIDPAVSPDGRRIAFSRANPAGRYRLALASIDDPSQPAWLTGNDDGPRNHTQPAWSQDGRRIAYTDTRDLWVIDVDTRQARPLTSASAGDVSPVWSSNGRDIVFTSEREGTRALWRVGAAGGEPERLTSGSGPEGHPSISADGSKLVYSTYATDDDVALLDLASGRSELIKSLLYDAFPAFAPDGHSLVFTSARRGGRWDLWRQPLAAGRISGPPVPLTDLPGGVNMPACSPHGRWIAFKREVARAREIWVMPAAGGMAERFSDGAGRDIHPAWSPDGSWLAYASERGAQTNLWIAPIANGRRSGPSRRVTSGEAPNWLPAWSPDGTRIAYVQVTTTGSEIRIVPSTGGTPSAPRAQAAQIGRLRWDAATGWLWFAAVDASGQVRLLKVRDRDGAEAMEAVPPARFAAAAVPGDFDVSADGRVLAYTREDVRGDIWLLESGRTTY